MFWRKRTYEDSELGILKYETGLWRSEVTSPEGETLFIDLDGDKSAPDEQCLAQARVLLNGLTDPKDQAKAFIAGQDLGEFSRPANGELVFDGYYTRAAAGRFDLNFGLSNWDDASIVVHFRNGRPYEISLGD